MKITATTYMRMMTLTMVMQRPYNRNTADVECKSKCDTGNNRGNWNNLEIIQKIPEQHKREAQNQGTAENSHICVFCTCIEKHQ
jgi:hypothetical protein